jgi:polysaccharide export outer membrane protein
VNLGFSIFVLALFLYLPAVAQEKTAVPTALPNAAILGTPDALASEYVVGAADVLDINVWKEAELSRSGVAVRPDGMISLPLIGVIKVSGMTPSQIQDVLAERLHRYLSVVRVTVTVAEIKSKFVYVTGEVNKPGVYPLLTPTVVLQAIIRAGGLTPYARSKSIAILRQVDGKQQRIPVNYKKLVHGDIAEQNIQLLPGDTVFVP